MILRFERLGIGLMLWLLTAMNFPGTCIGQDRLQSLRAGAYAQDITPTKWPISVNGGMSDVQATAAHDPLFARCLVLKNEENSLAIIVCDSCAIPRELMDRAKLRIAANTGIPDSNILISATHAHSCPTAASVFQSEPDQDYVELLVEQIATGVEKACRQLEPARIGWGSVEQRSLLFNRRWLVKEDEQLGNAVQNPFGAKSDRVITNPGHNNSRVSKSINLIDPELSFLSVQSRDGRPMALLANYSLHYIGGVPAGVVSADYFGEFSERVTRNLNAASQQPPFVAMMSNGTSGDVNNVDFRQTSAEKREPFEQITFAAELLSRDIASAYKDIEYYDAIPLKAQQAEIVLEVRKPNAEEVAAAEKRLAEITDRPLRDLSEIYARETKLLAKYNASVSVKLQVLRIGSLAIAACPCETFTQTGLNLKKTSPFKKTFTISLANGYNGYLPPPDQHLLGGYETWRARSSYLSAESEPKIVSTLERLLSELNQ